jgi:hypothetical protein
MLSVGFIHQTYFAEIRLVPPLDIWTMAFVGSISVTSLIFSIKRLRVIQIKDIKNVTTFKVKCQSREAGDIKEGSIDLNIGSGENKSGKSFVKSNTHNALMAHEDKCAVFFSRQAKNC